MMLKRSLTGLTYLSPLSLFGQIYFFQMMKAVEVVKTEVFLMMMKYQVVYQIYIRS